jgi:hypothetical protein
MHLGFFPFGFVVGGVFFFLFKNLKKKIKGFFWGFWGGVFSLFPMCSQCVLNMFSTALLLQWM